MEMDNKKLPKILTKDDRANLLKACENKELGIGIYLLLFAGLRPGELINLKWESIDFENKLIKITRYIPIEPVLFEQLKKHKKNQILRGTLATSDSYVLSNNGVDKVPINNYSRYIKTISRESDVDNINSACLRYNYAYNLLQSGVPINNVLKYCGYKSNYII